MINIPKKCPQARIGETACAASIIIAELKECWDEALEAAARYGVLEGVA